MKIRCKSCGDDLEVPDPAPRRFIFDFGLRSLWENLFSGEGILIVTILCAIGIPAMMGVFSRDSEYDAIKKALETPGIKVEVFKESEGKVQWKIVK